LRGLRYVLPFQEADPDVAKREKELFWIMYTEGAKCRRYSRFSVWLLFFVAASLFTAAILIIIYQMWASVPKPIIRYANIVTAPS
jgi:hypothetical protein